MTVMDRTIVTTMLSVLADMDGMGAVVMSHEEGSKRVTFSAAGHEPVVVEWSETDYHSDLQRVRGALKAEFLPHPEGQFVAVCCDVIDLGEKVDDYPGTPPKLSPKCALVFRTGEKNADTSEAIDIAQEYTVSMGEKANLRKALESWRGKPYRKGER